MLFVGDVAFNDQYRELLEAGSNPFRAIGPAMEGYDLVVGNLECMARGTRFNRLKVPYVHTSVRALELGLPQLHLRLMSTANNHCHDNMADGYSASIKTLDELGIRHVGTSLSPEDCGKPAIVEIKGLKFGFLNYVHSDTHPSIPPDPEVFPNFFDEDKILADVKNLKPQVDHVILLLHWGGKTDYGHLPHHEQIGQAQRMVDAGASAIVGCHTHAFQGWRTYKGVPVYYGLGNFCFADIDCEGVWSRVRNSGKWSAMAEITFGPKQTRHRFIPISSFNHRLKIDHTYRWPIWFWQWILIKFTLFPSLYPLYYRYLHRIEPVFFHAQLHNTTVIGLAWRKLLRILRLAR